MSKRSGKKPLEWVFNSVNTTTDTVVQDRIELGLKDDEVAQIHRIDSLLDYGKLLDAGPADDSAMLNMMLSMDPDINIARDPAVAVNHEDLEVFFENQVGADLQSAAVGQSVDEKGNKTKSVAYDPPILVGTDVGHIAHCESTNNNTIGQSWVRLYFTRRKANVMELNQILLKRR